MQKTLDPDDIAREHGIDHLRGLFDLASRANGRAAKEFDCDGIASGDISIAPDQDADTALHYVDIAREPIPPRAWAVPERVPASNVTLLSGPGAIGKSLLLLQLSAAHVLGRDWIGTLPERGPVLYVGCEDDADEVCRRLEDIAVNYGVTRRDMTVAGLSILSLAGKDAVLGAADRHGHMCATPLFEQIKRDAVSIRPKLIVLDTAADTFAGNENDRAQTRQFITQLRGLAIESGAAVILASHPSLTGIATDTGLSGNTAWHNSVRARMYLKPASDLDDPALRLLEVKKNNYGPNSETILLRWRNGVFGPEPRAGSLERKADDNKVDGVFLDLLRRFAKQDRNVTDKPGSTYAPAIFAPEPEAKDAKIGKRALAEAMRRLFFANRIRVIKEGPPSKLRTRLVEVGG
jgi:RecA-family ATPase